MKFPPSGFEEICHVYGDPRSYVDRKDEWESRILEYFDLPYPLSYLGQPVRRIRAHRKAGLFFVAAFSRIAERGLEDKAREYGGIYNFRASRTTQRFSTHVWGIAIDLNPTANPLGGDSTQNTEVIDIFERLGFRWGGRFSGTRDPMHFQLGYSY